ncbi:MAG TPA: hypothetical protein VLH94_02695 [Spirochaetia bacterium]|nr:hypothetical protein [Spirochaetia bacterium]
MNIQPSISNQDFKKELVLFAANFSDVVKRENWVSRYDPESDSLSYSVKELPKSSRLKYFNDEFALYVTNRNKINGIFIEYFMSNFLNHTKGFKDVKDEISKKDIKEIDKILEIKTVEKDKFIDKFQNVLMMNVTKDINFGSSFTIV